MVLFSIKSWTCTANPGIGCLVRFCRARLCFKRVASERVAETYRYCSNHRRACEKYFPPYHCPERLPLNKSVCDLCQTSDLCLAGCGKRIPKYTTYCSLHREEDELKGLVKQRTNLQGLIHEVKRFKTWWSNKNVATIITINGNSCWVFLGVIDRKPNNTGKIQDNEIFIFPTNHSETKWGIYPRKEHDSLAYAQSEASWLKDKLNGDNPMLVIHPQANNYTSFTNIVCEPYVIKRNFSDRKVGDISMSKKKYVRYRLLSYWNMFG